MHSDLMAALGPILSVLPDNLANHLMLTMIALAAGLVLSLPLGVVIARRRRLRYWVLLVVSIIQTIPSLALLALMVPVLVAIGTVTQWAFGIRLSTLGFWPTVIALTLYSILPILRNTVTGILSIDAAIHEAAVAVGMKPLQVLWRVQLPLAAPVILAGIRTATVWVVGIATLSTPVGQRSLGNFIFKGLQTQNWLMVLVGCISAALLAMLLDMLIGGLERAVAIRRPRLGILCGWALAAVLAAGLAAPSVVRTAGFSGSSAAVMSGGVEGFRLRRSIHIGAKNFTEQFILAQLIQDTLRQSGYDAQRREGLGSTVIFAALAAGEIDIYVDYSGTLWANHMQRSGSAPAAVVQDEVTWWLAHHHSIRVLGSLGFENSYALAMRREHAERLGIESIADLAEHAPQLTMAGDYEFFGRPEWRDLRRAYGLQMRQLIDMDSTFMYPALVNGEVDVISAFSSDGRIAAFDLITLRDPAQVIPPYDALVLVNAAVAQDAHLIEVLRGLIQAISIETMREANYRVDRGQDKKSLMETSKWLAEQIDQRVADEPAMPAFRP